MIFSYDGMNQALKTIGYYYNKILFVNFNDNTYKIIKIEDEEYRSIKNSDMEFYDWINGFKESPYSMNLNYNFDPDILNNLDRPIVLNYKKMINKQMKDVTMELVPVGKGRAYIFIKDMSASVPVVCTKEECSRCSNPC